MDKKYLRTKLNAILQGGIRLCLLTSVAFTVTACYAPANPELDEPTRWGNDSTTTQSSTPQQASSRTAEEQIAAMQTSETAAAPTASDSPETALQ